MFSRYPHVLLCFLILLCSTPLGLAEQNVVVVLDDSGSMEETMRTASGRIRRINAAKQALFEVLSNLPDGTNVGVLALNTQVAGSNWIVPFGPADNQQLSENIQAIRAEGGTPLGEFLKEGADQLLDARSEQIYGTYRLLVVTDGEANDKNLVETFLPSILGKGIVVDVIGVDMGSKHSLATKVHNYRSADDDTSLREAISEVFAETSATDQNSEEDFEILAGLPDEFAARAIETLTERDNQPIEPVQPRAFPRDTSGSNGAAVSSAVIGFVCCFGSVAGLVLLIVVLVAVTKSSTRNRP